MSMAAVSVTAAAAAAAGDSSILLRMKEDYDGAEPAATSIAIDNLWRLAGYSGTQVGG